MRVVSWDGHLINDTTNYSATLTMRPLLWDAQAQMVDRNDARPVISNIEYGPARFVVTIAIEGEDANTLRKQLGQWFNHRDKRVKPLVIDDNDGGRERYLMCICEGLRPRGNEGRLFFVANLVLDGFGDPDGRWRRTSISSTSWVIESSGSTIEIDNEGDDLAYPTFIIEPTDAKTGDYAFRRWCPILWQMDVTVNNYPTELTGGLDTEALITATKMMSNGNDLRVFVNGNQVDRYLGGINTTGTKVWANISYQPRARGALTNAILSGDTVLTLDVETGEMELDGGWFDLFPSSGILLIGDEAFTYTGKNSSLFRFTGVRRAQRGTTAAAHDAGDIVHWVQHDIYLLYGNSSAGTPPSSNSARPMPSPGGSSNEAWFYEQFYDTDNLLRPGRWSQLGEAATFYGGNQGTFANPYVELGTNRIAFISEISAWYTFNPCGITNVNVESGEKFTRDSEWLAWIAGIDSSPDGSTWTGQEEIDQPTVDDEWQDWDADVAMPGGTIYVRLRHWSIMGEQAQSWLEATDVTLTLDETQTPVANVGGELGNYQLNCTITNNTNDQAIRVSYTMAINQEFVVNTDNKTLIDLDDDSSQFQALALIGLPRRDWIPLEVGVNELQFDDPGTNGVTVTVQWHERHFD